MTRDDFTDPQWIWLNMTRDDLTDPQWIWLNLIRFAGRAGYSAAARHPVPCALRRRGLVTDAHCPTDPRNRRWHATHDGRALVDADFAARC